MSRRRIHKTPHLKRREAHFWSQGLEHDKEMTDKNVPFKKCAQNNNHTFLR